MNILKHAKAFINSFFLSATTFSFILHEPSFLLVFSHFRAILQLSCFFVLDSQHQMRKKTIYLAYNFLCSFVSTFQPCFVHLVPRFSFEFSISSTLKPSTMMKDKMLLERFFCVFLSICYSFYE